MALGISEFFSKISRTGLAAVFAAIKKVSFVADTFLIYDEYRSHYSNHSVVRDFHLRELGHFFYDAV